MIITCYTCHQPFTVWSWNPLRQTVVCPVGSCGRHVHVAEAAKGSYGDRVGKEVHDLIMSLSRLADRGRDSVAHLVDLSARRIEAIMNAAERAQLLEQQGDVVAQVLKP